MDQHYRNELSSKFDLTKQMQSYTEFLEAVCQKYNFYSKDQINDIHRATEFLYAEMMNAKICKINYDK